jgi:hypothetical protein
VFFLFGISIHVSGTCVRQETDGVLGVLPQMDEFSFTTTEKKILKIEDALFRISLMTESLQ